ncbi:YtfJ family protein [Escherichia coli]|uniref:YtfJ family protein n=2 Tax=Escherichia coli TaxID=562 RepID=UPI0022B93412|nr:YtfJ family protein [Escherichia coli]
MPSRWIVALIIALLAPGAAAHNFVTGKTVTPVYIQEGGELLLNSDDEIHYQKWNSTQLTGKVRIIQYIAGRKSAKKKNSLLIKAVEAANFSQDRFQPTTIVNTDDAIFGTGYFVVGKIEKNKRRYPWAQFVIDGNGLGRVAWQSTFTSMNLEELSMPGNTFSVRQLNHYIHYLQETGQPSSEYRLALWEKLGQPILTLAMILLAVPFTFSAPRSPGMGSRLAVGVIVGLLTWISYQIMVNLGLLFALSAPVTALGLPVAFVLVALSLVYWHDRQH